jgi:hypothetical protein
LAAVGLHGRFDLHHRLVASRGASLANRLPAAVSLSFLLFFFVFFFVFFLVVARHVVT